MADENKRKLHVTTIVYWVLLLYIIAALVWWFFSLYTQNRDMFLLNKQNLSSLQDKVEYQKQLDVFEVQRLFFSSYVLKKIPG